MGRALAGCIHLVCSPRVYLTLLGGGGGGCGTRPEQLLCSLYGHSCTVLPAAGRWQSFAAYLVVAAREWQW